MNPDQSSDIPDIADIHLAHARIDEWTRVTPVLNDPGLDQLLGCKVFCKCENLQRTGSFKFRGASNAILKLREDGIEGDVATHSSGNHGAALALAATLDGRKAHVVMPENSVPMKIEAVRRNGGNVVFCAPRQQAREEELEKLVQAGCHPVHPYDSATIIAGQGTATLELVQEVPNLDFVVTPVGGGGLVSGAAIATAPYGISVIGAEPAGAADTAASLEQGSRVDSWQPDTIADGLRALVGVRNFNVIQSSVKSVFTMTDEEIRHAMVMFWQTLRLAIEPSSATVISAVLKHPEVFSGRTVGVIISGGNLDPGTWSEMTADSASTT